MDEQIECMIAPDVVAAHCVVESQGQAYNRAAIHGQTTGTVPGQNRRGKTSDGGVVTDGRDIIKQEGDLERIVKSDRGEQEQPGGEQCGPKAVGSEILVRMVHALLAKSLSDWAAVINPGA